MQGIIAFFVLSLLLCHAAHGKFVDLSWSLDSDVISYWAGHTKYSSKVVMAGPFLSVPWVASNDFSTGEHIGTHLDAPYHFDRNGKFIDQILFDQLHGPAVVIDIRGRAEQNSDAIVTKEDLLEWEEKHGRIPDKAWIIMNSGWYKYWGDNLKYLGTNSASLDDKGDWHWPGFGEEAVDWLLSNRAGFSGIATDTVSCEPGNITSDPVHTCPVHSMLLGAGKLCLENVNDNVALLPVSGAEVFNLPMKLHHGTGAPTRFYAIHGETTSAAAAAATHLNSLTLNLILLVAVRNIFL